MNNTSSSVYLDYAATTPVDERVLAKMLPYYREQFGNPSSVHRYGQQADTALEHSRQIVAGVVGCTPREIIFTGCGSESDNLAIRGAAFSARARRGANHLLISPVEHHAVTHTANQLAKLFGFEVEYLSVDLSGRVAPDEVAKRLRPNTALVSVMYANNEIGTLNPIAEIGALCREQSIAFHSDAVQAAAYFPVEVEALQVDLLALGAHKFYGPKGVGALYVREGLDIIPHLTGGSQEFGLRAGTSNIPYIVGMAEALQLAAIEREERTKHVLALRERIIKTVLKTIPGSQLTGHPEERMPNHASFVFENVDGNTLLSLLDIEGFACSSGSACKTGDPEPSNVLIALGMQRHLALSSLRVTLGTPTTSSEVDRFLEILPEAVQRVRSLATLAQG